MPVAKKYWCSIWSRIYINSYCINRIMTKDFSRKKFLELFPGIPSSLSTQSVWFGCSCDLPNIHVIVVLILYMYVLNWLNCMSKMWIYQVWYGVSLWYPASVMIGVIIIVMYNIWLDYSSRPVLTMLFLLSDLSCLAVSAAESEDVSRLSPALSWRDFLLPWLRVSLPDGILSTNSTINRNYQSTCTVHHT